jgi:hypothetical protein
MILTKEERNNALASVIEMVFKPDFDVSSISVDAPAREVLSEKVNTKAYKDTGVRVITIIGHVPADWQTGYLPETSDNADDLPGLEE